MRRMLTQQWEGGGGGGIVPIMDLHEKGTYFRLVYKRVGISQVEVQERVGKSLVLKGL